MVGVRNRAGVVDDCVPPESFEELVRPTPEQDRVETRDGRRGGSGLLLVRHDPLQVPVRSCKVPVRRHPVEHHDPSCESHCCPRGRVMYSRITASSRATVETKYLRAQQSTPSLHAGARPECFAVRIPEWDEGLHRLLSSTRAYFARFQTTVAVPPPDAAAAVYRSWSPLMVNGRFCSVLLQLGNVAVSILKVKVLSAALTDKVPKWARLPPTIALFSFAVAVVRLFEATLGRSAREKAIT